MTRVATVPALARLKARFVTDNTPRVLLHRGTCGDAAGADGLAEQFRTVAGDRLVEATCDGACWAAPAATVQRDGHSHRFAHLDLPAGPPDELTRCLAGDCDDEYAGRGQYGLLERVGRNDGSLADMLARGAYAALAHAARLEPERVIEVVEAAGVTHAAATEGWRLAATLPEPRYLVVHDVDDEATAIKDRHLLEGDPHRLIEGMLIACHAAAIDRALVDMDGSTDQGRDAVDAALAQAAEHGILDGSSLGNRPVAIEVRSDSGGAANNEESVIASVESLCAITTAFDTPPPPTKLISLSGAIPRPGLYEVPIDGNTTWAGILAMAGVMPGLVPAIRLGGTPGRLVLPEEYEVPLTRTTLAMDGAVILSRDADLDEG